MTKEILFSEMDEFDGSTSADLILNLSLLNQSDNGTYSDYYALPYYLTFNEDSVREVSLYSLLFVLAAAGNVPVFATLLKNRHRKSRVNLMITHLAIADLIVTFVMIPLEICWRITVEWIAGNAVCKIMLFLRAFGPYLSSMVLVCISLDRYFAILHPLKVNDAQRRGKVMLSFAWAISLLCSIPQSVIFHVESHPEYPKFRQCVSFNFFPTEFHKMAYNLFCLLALYGVPLLIIVFCYSRILFAISKRSRETEVLLILDDMTREQRFRGRLRLRRSDIAHIERARTRTLKMTIIIVLAFFWCWTPYVVMVLWYLFDPKSAEKVDSRIQSSLFMFAVSNSCVNPLVYGSYVLNFKKLCKQCFCGKKEQPSPAMRRRYADNHTVTTATFRSKMKDKSPSPKPITVNLKMNGNGTYPELVREESYRTNHVDGYRRENYSTMSSATITIEPHFAHDKITTYHSAVF